MRQFLPSGPPTGFVSLLYMEHRLFVGIDLPEAHKMALAQIKRDIPGLRWQATDSYHITLCFLGKTDSARFVAVDSALAETITGCMPCTLAPASLGVFVSRGRVRALWCGFKPSAELARLHAAISAVLVEKAGQVAATRPFLPHVTLAKSRGIPSMRLDSILQERGDLPLPAFTMTQIILYSSHPTPKGSHYIKEKTYETLPQGTDA